MQILGLSDTGLVRNSNQDAFYCHNVSDTCAWTVVCDGMGGVNGGSIASQTAVETIKQRFIDEFSLELNPQEIKSKMADVMSEANRVIYAMAQNDTALHGMGTTCEFILVKDGQIYITHIGDSRTYIIHEGKLSQLTEDHSVVQELVRRGEITPEEAENHPNKNYITRALGILPDITFDFVNCDMAFGDVLLVCTDGLTNCISNADIIMTIQQNIGDDLLQTLIDKAKAGGGYDNITAVVMY